MGKQRSKESVSLILLSLLCIFTICLFPVAFLYAQNAAEAVLSDCLVPAVLFFGIAFAIWLAEYLVSKQAVKSALSTALAMILLLNFALIEKLALKITYEARYWHVLAVLLVVIIQGSGIIFKKLPESVSQVAVQVIPLVFGILIVINLAMAVPTMLARAQAERQTRENGEAQAAAVKSDGNLPNIYFLIFDEYSSNAQILKYYDYDNSPLTDRLAQMGFNLSFTGHNESIMTSTITTNLVNLDYIVDNTWEEFDKETKRVNGALFALLKSKGYTLNGAVAADYYALPEMDNTQSSSSAKTVDGDTLGDLLLKKTVAYPLIVQHAVAFDEPIEMILNFSMEHRNDSQFVMAHFNLPHEPFFFDSDGNPNVVSSSDWRDKKLYLGQYIFAGKVMETLAAGIIKNDPDSIIIIQSDHGARASSDSELFMVMFELDEMNNFFNAVYCAGEEVDIEGLSGVNTLRTVLNRVLGMDMEMLPVPEDTFAYRN